MMLAITFVFACRPMQSWTAVFRAIGAMILKWSHKHGMPDPSVCRCRLPAQQAQQVLHPAAVEQWHLQKLQTKWRSMTA